MAKSKKLLDAIERFPLLSKCFSPYIKWLVENVKECLDEYDLIKAIKEKEYHRLEKLENLLQRAKQILEMNKEKFSRTFGFTNDLLIEEPEKIHDILAEPLFIVDLDEAGFTSIIKLPKSISIANQKMKNADFTAVYKSDKFVIELKTIRTENNLNTNQMIGDATKPYWWGHMLRNNIITKIEDKGRRVLSQLENGAKHYGCRFKMLAIYTRRLGTSTLMNKKDYCEELKWFREQYPEIDYMAVKEYFGPVVFYPELLEQ